MTGQYPDFSKNESHALLNCAKNSSGSDLTKVAYSLLRRRIHPSRLSPLIFITDPIRVNDPVSVAMSLPRGCAVIYRHFGSSDRFAVAKNLREVTHSRDQQFLIGADAPLAIESGADGVHFKRDKTLEAATYWRQMQPSWLITMAGLKESYIGYEVPLDCLDALFVSSVFQSQSPSAGPPLGLDRFSKICTSLKVPVIALGGINSLSASKVLDTHAAGIAAVSALL